MEATAPEPHANGDDSRHRAADSTAGGASAAPSIVTVGDAAGPQAADAASADRLAAAQAAGTAGAGAGAAGAAGTAEGDRPARRRRWDSAGQGADVAAAAGGADGAAAAASTASAGVTPPAAEAGAGEKRRRRWGPEAATVSVSAFCAYSSLSLSSTARCLLFSPLHCSYCVFTPVHASQDVPSTAGAAVLATAPLPLPGPPASDGGRADDASTPAAGGDGAATSGRRRRWDSAGDGAPAEAANPLALALVNSGLAGIAQLPPQQSSLALIAQQQSAVKLPDMEYILVRPRRSRALQQQRPQAPRCAGELTKHTLHSTRHRRRTSRGRLSRRRRSRRTTLRPSRSTSGCAGSSSASREVRSARTVPGGGGALAGGTAPSAAHLHAPASCQTTGRRPL